MIPVSGTMDSTVPVVFKKSKESLSMKTIKEILLNLE